jgi:formate hydrogenlyase subunit 3/multisubunit Na+/H+ antiporter MnhD subunit
MRDRPHVNQFYGYLLISQAMVNGAVLADHLVVLLFFWEGLLATLFGMVAIGSKGAFKTATKAFIIVGLTDLCMMFGIALTGHAAGTLVISQIHHLPLNAIGCVAMLLLSIGAVSKAGSMPFHSWIPDAAIAAPLPFMAFLPASLEKLLGIYFLARITLDLFQLVPSSLMSVLLMTLGCVTILLAVMMALVQKDYKKLLSYHAISQVGYMVLGIGTALPIGIVGGLFHMLNHAMYKSCLFLTAGAVEKQTGTTSLERLGGLGARMPITFGCFIVAAASISGVPPFNGFFSKELVYDAALERHVIFYVAALLGSFFTAASFLKLGHAAFLGPRDPMHNEVKEAPWAMLVPMLAIAGLCILFGVRNALPLERLIQPILGAAQLEGHSFAGFPTNVALVALTVAVLIGALLNHLFGVRHGGSGLHAADHVQHAPVLEGTYVRAERGDFDPYNIGLKTADGVASLAWRADRATDWLTSTGPAGLSVWLARRIRQCHTGNYALYVVWALAAALAIMAFLVCHSPA